MKKLLVFIVSLSIAVVVYAQNKTIAVPAPKTVNLGSGSEWVPLFVQGLITTNFQQYSGMKVIDRQNADMIKAEQRLSENAEFDESTAVELGKLTNARFIITGSITKKSSNYALTFNITDAETGETKASATVPNCSASSLESGEAANHISYDLMVGYGIKLDKKTKEKLTKKAKKDEQEEIVAQASLAKGIASEQSGTSVEALTYYVQAKKANKNLSEATNRMMNLTSVVSQGNYGQYAKNMIKLRNDWDKLLRETTEMIAANPPELALRYYSDITPLEMTEENYNKQTMSFYISLPYLEQTNRQEYLEYAQVVEKLKSAIRNIPESKNWGDKINGFPWTYADDIKGYNWLKQAWPYDKNLKDGQKVVATVDSNSGFAKTVYYFHKCRFNEQILCLSVIQNVQVYNDPAKLLDSDGFRIYILILDANKKVIAKEEQYIKLQYFRDFIQPFAAVAGYERSWPSKIVFFHKGNKYDKILFKNVKVNDLDTNKIYVKVEYSGKKNISILPADNTVASSSNSKGSRIMVAKENLRLRKGEQTSSDVITTLKAGSAVKILQVGKSDNIDGIKSNWVKVEVQSGAKNRDGKEIKAGVTGWCYAGYLK